MLQAGYPTISPVTTRFRTSDVPRLDLLTKRAKTLYIVPDNEKNMAGYRGAIDTAEKLEQLGRSVYLINIPRPDDVEKIDVTDFLRDNGPDSFKQLIANAKTPLQLEIDYIAEEKLDEVKLSERLIPVKEKLAAMTEDRAGGYLDYIKRTLKAKPAFMQGLKKSITKLRKSKALESDGDDTPIFSAIFPELIDIVTDEDKPGYLVKTESGFELETTHTDKKGAVHKPPPAMVIPFEILPGKQIIDHRDDTNRKLYTDLFNKLKTVSVLPSDEPYHLCTVYIFFTYIAESSPYYPYLWFHGLPERGKSRMVKAMAYLSYRGFYTETLNEAYIFRLADRFGVTLALDVYELSKKAHRKESHDLLLGRFERGMKIARVTNPDRPAFQDMTYFKVSGPTILATNIEIDLRDPLHSRCIKITMPEARGIYPNITNEDLKALKARLLSFRGRHLGESLPELEKPISGRLGDILHPLLCVAKLLPNEAYQALNGLIKKFEEDRKQAEAESLPGLIAQALYDLKDEVENGRLPVEKVTEELNKDTQEKYKIAPQTVGKTLSSMGVQRKKSRGKMQIIFSKKVIEKIWERFPPQEHTPPSPPSP
jgi:hypothetical protein